MVYPIYIILLIAIPLALATVLVVTGINHKKSLGHSREALSDSKAEIELLRQENDRYQKLLNTFQDAAAQYADLRDGVATALDSSNPLIAVADMLKQDRVYPSRLSPEQGEALLQQLHDRAADAELALRNLQTVKTAQQHIKQFVDTMQAQQQPDEAAMRSNRSALVSLAMMLADTVDSIDNPNATDDRQGINVALLKGDITPDEALAKATPVNTDVDDSTYRWARMLQTSLRSGMDLDDSHVYILRGWSFTPSQQPA